jgi:putative transposase
MPRKPRFYLPDVPAHVMQRGHNRSPVFFDNEDYLEYLRILKVMAEKYECMIHAYVLMTNHIHLLLTPASQNSISLMFQGLGRQYVTYINKTYGLSGTLWEGRHKGNPIDSDVYFLACMRYIELNPMRAGMCTGPADYRWSSYAANALGEANSILVPHEKYCQLGDDMSIRQNNYLTLLSERLDADVISDFRKGVQSGTPIGCEYFKQRIEEILKCKIGYTGRVILMAMDY